MKRSLVIMFVWYGIDGSARYDHFEDGLMVHARRNDAVAWYLIDSDGRLIHLYDDPTPRTV